MGSNPQSDPRIFPEIPGFSRSLTHGLTHGVFYRPTLFACTEIPKKPEATGSAGRCEPGVGRFTDPHPLTCCYFTPSLLAIFGDFSTLPTQGRIRLFGAWGGSLSPPWMRNRHTGPNGGQQGGSRSRLLLGTKKTAAWVSLAAVLCLCYGVCWKSSDSSSSSGPKRYFCRR